MRRAIRLSRRGFPAPNPHVGCVLVRDGEAIGEGFHDHAGGPHAERVALAAAGDARGADAYVTLEPCNHTGRTGPCSEALIQAGVRRVFYAVPDPNPRAAGGAERLREAGVEVHGGLLGDAAEVANRQFLFTMRHERPWIVLKAATTLDGRIALPNGESKWITSEEARQAAHALRAELGAVLVGRRTVELDDPELTARIPGVVNQPLRIVLDPSGRLTGREKVFNDKAETLHITGPIDLPELLRSLRARGCTGLLVEGGAVTIGRFLEQRLGDRIEMFVAPKLFGHGQSWLQMGSVKCIEDAIRLEATIVRRVGPDLRIVSTPVWN